MLCSFEKVPAPLSSQHLNAKSFIPMPPSAYNRMEGARAGKNQVLFYSGGRSLSPCISRSIRTRKSKRMPSVLSQPPSVLNGTINHRMIRLIYLVEISQARQRARNKAHLD